MVIYYVNLKENVGIIYSMLFTHPKKIKGMFNTAINREDLKRLFVVVHPVTISGDVLCIMNASRSSSNWKFKPGVGTISPFLSLSSLFF